MIALWSPSEAFQSGTAIRQCFQNGMHKTECNPDYAETSDIVVPMTSTKDQNRQRDPESLFVSWIQSQGVAI
jgi:hypothetical protein